MVNMVQVEVEQLIPNPHTLRELFIVFYIHWPRPIYQHKVAVRVGLNKVGISLLNEGEELVTLRQVNGGL